MKEQELKEIERLRKAIENAKEYDEQSVSVRIDLLESFFSTIEAQAKELERLKEYKYQMHRNIEEWQEAAETQKNNNLAILRDMEQLREQLNKAVEGLESIIYGGHNMSWMQIHDQLKTTVSLLQGKEPCKTCYGKGKVALTGSAKLFPDRFPDEWVACPDCVGKEQNQTDTEPMD